MDKETKDIGEVVLAPPDGGAESRPVPPARLFGTSTGRALLVAAVMLATLVGAGGLASGGGSTGRPTAGPAQRPVEAAAAARSVERPQGCVAPDRRLNLYAVELPRDPVTNQVRLGYGLTPQTASYPGPTMEMIEGECLAITLHNQVPAATLEALRTDPAHPVGVSLHVHGVKYTQQSDGTVHSNSFVPPGGSRTYFWFAKPRTGTSQGTAGYWWYHDHVVGGPHGTQGLRSGLFGGLVVRRQGDPRPDRTYVTVFGDRQTINLRRSAEADTCDPVNPVPGPTCLVARLGERVEFIVVGIGDDMHTFHVHGHSWADTRTGLAEGSKALVDSIPIIDNKTLGPGDSFGVQIVAGDSVGPGHWMLHCHMQFHSDLGMSTTLHVLDENGQMPPHAGGHTPAASAGGAAAPAGGHPNHR
ncbi:multicopper oxidase domain-containing protein [Micromonospora sp. WMMD1102]|uniref:multicopper oxidase domain-containing protein n=1 Tax=Micromonospora sp. WMMD1102 TaxID=3016105 RepID=UPI0024155B8A|nr:multicopper oxidase domain-containing protein [Micromonospora sp. WMMD1102]MDG4786073.1 multicopper oxidase domain-containing protein [Micromonospora sp. WMMD1102]